jgi:hypothetical protein
MITHLATKENCHCVSPIRRRIKENSVHAVRDDAHALCKRAALLPGHKVQQRISLRLRDDNRCVALFEHVCLEPTRSRQLKPRDHAISDAGVEHGCLLEKVADTVYAIPHEAQRRAAFLGGAPGVSAIECTAQMFNVAGIKAVCANLGG